MPDPAGHAATDRDRGAHPRYQHTPVRRRGALARAGAPGPAMNRSRASWADLSAAPDGTLAGVTALVGAGASVDAGLPVAYGLLDEIVGCLVRRTWAAEELSRLARAPRPDMRDEHDFIRFETLLLWVSRVFDPGLDLFTFLDAFTIPGGLHRRLAHACTRGLALVTVNFDDLLERALLEQGAQPLTVDAQRPVSGAPPEVPVYKLHGSRMRHAGGGAAVDHGALLATTQTIAATHPGTFLNDSAAATLLSLVDGRTLLVAGYSASDDLDVVPTLAVSCPAHVVWIDHRDGPLRRRSALSARSQLPWQRLLLAMRDEGAELTIITGRTVEAFDALGLSEPGGLRGARRRHAHWPAMVRRWARRVRAHDPTGLGLAALLFGDLGRYELAERALAESRPSRLPNGRWTAARCVYEQGQAKLLREPSDPVQAYGLALRARKRASLPKDARTAVLAELLLGRAAFMQQHYRVAASHFRSAQQTTRVGSTEHAHAQAWQGRAQVWDGRPRLGLRYLQRATRAFREQGEVEGLLDALEATGVARLALMQLTDARDALTEANGLARALGYTDRRFTTICSLAEFHLLGGRALEAERRSRAALRAVAVGGHDEVADAWAVLAESAVELRRWRAAARAARRAIDTTTSINRNRVREHLCTLAEAQLLARTENAADRTLRAATSCADDEITPLGSARLTLLHAARDPDGSSPRVAMRALLPAALVRLAGSARRLAVTTVQTDRIIKAARELPESYDPPPVAD